MTATLTRHGKALSLELDAAVLRRLNIDESTPLDISFEGDAIVVRRAVAPISDEEFKSTLDDAHERYGNMLRKLAE